MVFKGVVKKSFFTHPRMKFIAFVAVSSFVVTTENGQGHVNQRFALTLDSLNSDYDSFSQDF